MTITSYKESEDMNTIEAIEARRSIRKYQEKAVPQGLIEKILEAATKAPSSENRQPWKFVVVEGDSKEEFVALLNDVMNKLNAHDIDTNSLKWSIKSMDRASIIILVLNSITEYTNDPYPTIDKRSNYKKYEWLEDIQSIGGAIQTMILAAQDLGLGTLWIGDMFYADKEICEWLNCDHELVAAVAVGYPNQSPDPRPRKSWQEVTEWKR